MLGAEPVCNSKSSQLDIARALNWYNYFHDIKVHRKWVVEYMKASKYNASYIDAYNRSPDHMTSSTMCAFARMLTRGLSSKHGKVLNEKLAVIIKTYKKAKTNVVILRKKDNTVIADLDAVLDRFYRNQYKPIKANLTTIIESSKSADIAQAAIYYQQLLDELSGPDAKEAYDHLTKKQLATYREVVAMFVGRLQQQKVNTKRTVVRKPRKKKVKSASQIASKAKYQQSDNTLGVVGLAPDKIVGASVAWVYNTKTRKLAKYVGTDANLSISRSSIINFDDKTSYSKKVRKPKEIITSVSTDGKAYVDKTIKQMKSKPSNVSGRLNEHSIIVRVFK
jgi:hypothetical protein